MQANPFIRSTLFLFFNLIVLTNCQVVVEKKNAFSETESYKKPILESIQIPKDLESEWKSQILPQTFRKDFISLAESGKLAELIASFNEKDARVKRQVSSATINDGNVTL